MIERIERLQRELAEIYDFHQSHLDRRTRTGMTTAIDTILARHQRALAEVLDFLEDLKTEKINEEEEGNDRRN